MLKRLYVKNYVLIDSLDIQFPEGLVIITGQTGAGKSIILGSISLVLGAKADVSVIGESADNCVVEAEFDVAPDDNLLKGLLEENEVEWDGGHLVLRRVVGRTGRARAFVNDSPVNTHLLSSISTRLIDIHSQHQTLLLSDRRFQMSVLDHFAGNASLLSGCQEAFRQFTALKLQLQDIEERISRIEAEKDYNETRFRQLDEAALKPGELESLEEEQRQLANAEEIKENLFAVENYFTAENDEDVLSVDAILRETVRRLEKVAAIVPSVSSLLERVDSCRVELDDVVSEISALNSRMELSQDRLQAVDERISFLYGLLNRFSCRTVGELIEERDRLGEALYDSDSLVARRDDIRKSLERSEAALLKSADRLHASRVKAAPGFAESIQDSIRFLELQQAVFEVEIQDAPVSAGGKDSVVFKFSSTGRNAVDVARCASGGELSRIMLCLKDMMARYTKMPTMIFDEIDTGVSGSVADRMGTMICAMGQHMQVFAITHLPQVAAKGDAHYLVSKEVNAGKTSTVIRKLSDGQRIMEVARMLSGSTVTDTAIANAKTLLNSR
ncbi:MAG: DNA repair protein RecN [Bacteroidales bacterium]|nr:DNA repair protein RecN [Bacteroidales bacterium]